MVDRTLSLNEGSITFPNFHVDSWYWQAYVNSGYFDNDKPLRDFTDDELQQLLYGTGPKVKTGGFSQSYEGLVDKVRRLHLTKDLDSMQPTLRRHVERVATTKPCPVCGGTRLSQGALAARINGKNIADCSAMQLTDLVETPGERLGSVQERRAARLLADPVHDDEADVGPRCPRAGRPAVVAWPGVQLPPHR